MPPKRAPKDPNELMRKALKSEVDDLLESGKIDSHAAGQIREKIYDDKFEEVKSIIEHLKKPKTAPVMDEAAQARAAKMAEIRERMAKAREARLTKAVHKPAPKKSPKGDIESLLKEMENFKMPSIGSTHNAEELFEGIESKIKHRKARRHSDSETKEMKIVRKIKKHSLAICELADKILH